MATYSAKHNKPGTKGQISHGHSRDVPRLVQFTGTERQWVLWVGEGNGELPLKGTVFRFGMIEGSGDG